LACEHYERHANASPTSAGAGSLERAVDPRERLLTTDQRDPLEDSGERWFLRSRRARLQALARHELVAQHNTAQRRLDRGRLLLLRVTSFRRMVPSQTERPDLLSGSARRRAKDGIS
jgi:hypothetical protein